jgi:hypothetical protein
VRVGDCFWSIAIEGRMTQRLPGAERRRRQREREEAWRANLTAALAQLAEMGVGGTVITAETNFRPDGTYGPGVG